MGDIVIGADTFSIYGTAAGLASHANGSTAYATYVSALAADADAVARVHVTATRQIAVLPFTDAANADPATAAGPVVTACYELVLAALVDPAVLTQASTGSNIAEVSAGDGVGVRYFAPVAGARFPSSVMVLLGPLLGSVSDGGSPSGGAYVAGASTCSDFDACDRYGLTSG